MSFRTEFCDEFGTANFLELILWFLIVVLLLCMMRLFFIFVFVIFLWFLLFLLSFFIFHIYYRFINPRHHPLYGFFLVLFDLKFVYVHSMGPLFATWSLQIELVIISSTTSPSSFHHGLISVGFIIGWNKPPRVRKAFMTIITFWPFIFLIQLINGLNFRFSSTNRL